MLYNLTWLVLCVQCFTTFQGWIYIPVLYNLKELDMGFNILQTYRLDMIFDVLQPYRVGYGIQCFTGMIMVSSVSQSYRVGYS